MTDKKQDFTVSDRRLFTSEGELRKDVVEEEAKPVVSPVPAADKQPPERSAENSPAATPAPSASGELGREVPPPPSAAEQQAGADAYHQSAKDLDRRVELSGHSATELQMSFERFMASLYMSAMLQLGLMHEEGGQPRIDLIGARQTIDTLGILKEKTKGNLTASEENFLQNSLYELRMAYVEVTNALARPPKAPESAAGTKAR
jgi:hypothetical protein